MRVVLELSLLNIFLGSVKFYVAILIFLLSLGSERSQNMCFISKNCKKVLMGICNVLLIVSDKNPCNIFSNNL